MRRLLALTVLFLLVVAACGDDATTDTSDDPGDTPGTPPSVTGDWILRSLTVDGIDVSLPVGDLEIRIELGEISGNLGCNSFSGEVDAADDGTLTIGALGQTEMACLDDGRMEFESTYGQALSSVTAWAVDPTGMTFSGGAVEIRYEPAPPPVHLPLEGTVWHFDTIYSGEGPDRVAENRADMEGVTLVIAGGEATIDAAGRCAGSIVVDHSGTTEGEIVPGSRSDLPDTVGCGIVDEALSGIADSTGFMIDESRLTFIGETGETVGFSARSE